MFAVSRNLLTASATALLMWQGLCLAQTAGAAIQPGGALAELANRSALRAYAVKMGEGRITADEVADYLIKGGSYQQDKSYDGVRNFFVGKGQGSVLRHFIDGPGNGERRLPADRLKSLQMLLDVGADPNLQGSSDGVGGENLLSPTLFAAAGNDLGALKLLVAKGGNLALREEKYAGRYGPALALATRADVLDFLLDNGANLAFTDENGNNLLALAVDRNHATDLLGKLRWLMSKGLSPRAPNQRGETAETRAQAALALVEERLKEADERLAQRLREVAAERWPHLQLSAQALQAMRKQEAQALQASHAEERTDLEGMRNHMQAALELFASSPAALGKP